MQKKSETTFKVSSSEFKKAITLISQHCRDGLAAFVMDSGSWHMDFRPTFFGTDLPLRNEAEARQLLQLIKAWDCISELLEAYTVELPEAKEKLHSLTCPLRGLEDEGAFRDSLWAVLDGDKTVADAFPSLSIANIPVRYRDAKG